VDVCILYDSTGKRRVRIVHRGSGRYGYDEERFSDEPLEMCWVPIPQMPLVVCDSPEAAERDARGQIPWLRDLSGSG
jgi:hypothetical protein